MHVLLTSETPPTWCASDSRQLGEVDPATGRLSLPRPCCRYAARVPEVEDSQPLQRIQETGLATLRQANSVAVAAAFWLDLAKRCEWRSHLSVVAISAETHVYTSAHAACDA